MTFETLGPVPFGSITDVAGVRVGHFARTGRGWQTGTTVVLAPDGATPGVDVRGGGPGTRETEAIAPDNLVQEIHAICLTGGSAYGLASADGVMSHLEAQRLGVPMGDGGNVVPVVPAAVIFDLGRGGEFGNRPDASFGERAARNTRVRQLKWGSVGAGTGAKASGLQGGVGTASMTVRIPGLPGKPSIVPGASTSAQPDVEIIVGAVAVANPNGSVIDPTTGLPWERSGLAMRRPATSERTELRAVLAGQATPRLNTTIGVVATSARLDKAEAGKVAAVAHDGMARAVRPAHSLFDGDTVFCLATGQTDLPGAHGASASPQRLDGSRQAAINLILAASADCFAAACTHAILAATTIGTSPAYRDLCPSALA